jgi:hypothetical protein
MIGLTMRLAPVISLLGLYVTGAAVIRCDDLSPSTCSDFCLGGDRVLHLEWFGLDCTQSPCDVAALAAEALATGVAEHARLSADHLSALPDFSVCDGFVCGNVYDCSYSSYSQLDESDLCSNFESYKEGQVCVSPDGLLIFAKYLDLDYCGVSSFDETIVTFSRNVTIMKQEAGLGYCQDDDAIEASLNADVTSLTAQIGSGPTSQTGQASATSAPVQGATIVYETESHYSEVYATAAPGSSQSLQASATPATVQGVPIGVVASGILSLMTPQWI